MSFDISQLNPAQKKAVETVDQPLLLLAGAGSGKTRVITYRIAHLIANCRVHPTRILALTFTNKASKEMRERVYELLKSKAKGTTVSTFHALCVGILRQYIDLLGYRKDFLIYGTNDQLAVVKNIMEDAGIDELGLFKPQEAQFEILKAKGDGHNASFFYEQKQDPRAQLMGNILENYNKILKGSNAIDFEDILFLVLDLIKNFPQDIAPLFEKYDYVLVDEYQDTNRTQYHIVKQLIARTRKLCVVGDDDQSIYGWRGADIRNILDFKKDFPETETIKLEQNYRSTNVILDAANQVIANNSSRMEKSLWTAQEGGELIRWVEEGTEPEELANVIYHMKSYHYKHGCKWNDFAILYRSNFQARVIEEALRDEGVDYRVIGGTKFFDRKEIQDPLAYMKFIHNPKDEVSLHRIINYPRRGIGKTTLMAMNDAQNETELSLFDVMQNAREVTKLSEGALRSIESFCETILDTRRRLAEEVPFYKVFREFFEDVGIKDELEKSEKNEKTREKKVTNFLEFVNGLYLYGERRGEEANLGKYLEYIALFTEGDDKKEEKDQVTLMTVHSSKGLEFDYVALVGLTAEQFPNKRAVQDGSLEEERRLFYVAITRARKCLSMSMAKMRMLYKDVVLNQMSPFLMEINPKLFNPPPFGDADPVQEKENKQKARSRVLGLKDRLKNLKTDQANDPHL